MKNSKYSEKTKRIIRFFADAEGPKTIRDLVEHLGLESPEDKIGDRKVRHTVGDLTYDGILRSWKPPGRHYCKYKITTVGKKVAATFHKPLPLKVTRVFDSAHQITDRSDNIIPKENEAVPPPSPTANVRTRKVAIANGSINIPVVSPADDGPELIEAKKTVSKLDQETISAMDKFEALYGQDPDQAILSLARQVIKTREELRALKEHLRLS